MPYSSTIIISSLALLFTVFSFWWMNWRPGNLIVGNIQHFAAGRGRVDHSEEPNSWFIGLPLILFNSGASPLIIESLRLSPVNVATAPKLLFNAVDTPLWTADPNSTKIDRNFTFLPHILKPNDAISENFVFILSGTEQKYESRMYYYRLEVKLLGKKKWKAVKNIELNFQNFSDNKLYELNTYYKPYHYRSDKSA